LRNPEGELFDVEVVFLNQKNGQVASHDFGQACHLPFLVGVLEPNHFPRSGVEKSPAFGRRLWNLVF